MVNISLYNISDWYVSSNICDIRSSCPDLHQKLVNNCLIMNNVIPDNFYGLINVVWIILILMVLEAIYELLIYYKIISPVLDFLGISLVRWTLRIFIAYWMARFINIWWLAKTNGLI